VDYLLVCGVAFAASLLTFFTGFGLGTLLLPAFAVFFPTEAAVALTAVVHLLNSLFKLALVGRHASWPIVLRFGIPAILAAFAGAGLLAWLAGLEPLYRYEVSGRSFEVLPVSFVIAVLMIVFAALELWPNKQRVAIPRRFLPLGGVVTGFFGGLSGHQGALRSAFLLRAGLDKQAFIATGVVIAAIVDVSRLTAYSQRFFSAGIGSHGALLVAAVLAAFAGALTGNRLMEKVSIRAVEVGVSLLLVLVALALGTGVI
jgi:uncharacterized membrane protein YfcA